MKKILIIAFLFIGLKGIGQIKLPAPLIRNSPIDSTYGTHYDSLGYKGFRTSSSITTRNAIPTVLRGLGMVVNVVGDSSYTLKNGLSNSDWVTYKPGGGSPYTITKNATRDSIILTNGVTTTILKDSFGISDLSKLNQISLLATYSGNSTILNITEEKRSGLFSLYAGADSADNGIIFLDGNNRKWKRQLSGDRKLNLQWFGAKSTTTGTNNDILPFLNAARNYIQAHRGEFDYIYIPFDGSGLKKYYVSNTFFISIDLRIIGDGITSYSNPQQTLLSYPINTTGIVINFANGQNAIRAEIESLQMTGNWTNQFTADPTKHGIVTNCVTFLKNVNVVGFSGDGVHIDACADPQQNIGGVYGNASGCKLVNVQADFCSNGLWINGCDANIIGVYDGNFTNNRRWGVYDASFLGNRYDNPHFAFNGSVIESNSIVTYLGKFYSATHKDNLINLNKNPLTNPNFWIQETPMQNTGAWDSTRTYVSGGSMLTTELTATTTITGMYNENFQPIPKFSDKTLNIGGLNSGYIGASISAYTKGIAFQGLLPGQAVNVIDTRLVVNTTKNDVDGIGNVMIADTIEPTIVIGGVGSLAGKKNAFSTIRYRSVDPNDNALLSYSMTYQNYGGKNAIRFIPDPASSSESTIDFNYDKSIRIPLFAGTGNRPVTADNTGKLVIGSSTTYTNGYGLNLVSNVFSVDSAASNGLVNKDRLTNTLLNYVDKTSPQTIGGIKTLTSTLNTQGINANANIDVRSGNSIIFSNGANTNSSYITNFDDGGFQLFTGGIGKVLEISNLGIPKFLRLATGLTPPTTTGTTRMVITDANGLHSFAAIPDSSKWSLTGSNISNKNSGNVGIGIAVPTSKLHVGGTVRATGSITSNDVGYFDQGLSSLGGSLSGFASFASGTGSNASNSDAIALGQNANASGEFAIAGSQSTASGRYSTAFSNGTAKALGGFATGQNNTGDAPDPLVAATTDRIFQVGTGGNNIVTTLRNGNTGFGLLVPTSTVSIGGSLSTTLANKSANYTVTASDNTINVTTAAVTITLPTAVGIQGREYTIINSTSGNITITTTSAQTIGNFVTTTSFTLATDKALKVQSTNANYVIKGQY